MILAYFPKDFKNHALIFARLDETKIVGKFWVKFEIPW